MFSITRNEILRPINAIAQAKRFRGKINIQKPRPPHFERAKYIALTQQYFKKPEKKPLHETCDKDVKYFERSAVENPYERILANELLDEIKSSRLIAFFHKNPFNGEQLFKARVLFNRQNMILKDYGRRTVQMAVKGTPYEAISNLFVSESMILFSAEPGVKKLISITKKFPQIVLLAGILEGKFVSRDDLQKYSMIPNLVTAQAQFVQTLNSVGGQLTSNLNSRSQILVSQLQERVKQLEEK